MEAFALLKFWKTTNAKVAAGTTASDCDGAETVADSTVSDPLTEDTDDDYDDDDDSFFELELALPNHGSKISKPDPCLKKPGQERDSDRKPTSKPQSPISILRSASPKLRVFMFGRLGRKSKAEEFETESLASNFSPKSDNSSLFTVKFQIEDGSIVPKFTRTNSSSTLSSPKLLRRQKSDDCDASSKRFSKDVVQKYLNLIKPLYVKSSKRYDMEKSMASPTRYTASCLSPRKEREEKQSSRFMVKGKKLGKSKSDSSMIGASSPAIFPVRNDHAHDGIEGAILHCKRSLNSSRGHSSLSRCSSDPSHEKSVQMSERNSETSK